MSRVFQQKKIPTTRRIQPHTFGHYTLDNVIRALAANGIAYEKENYFSFTFVRNPFDRLLSSYLNYTVRNTPNFDAYIDMVAEVVETRRYVDHESIRSNDLSHYIPQCTMLGGYELDFVGRFENFQQDLGRLSELTGIEALRLANIRKRPVDYHDFFNARNRDIVADIYAEDLLRFAYSF